MIWLIHGLKADRTSTDDAEPSGRLKEADTEENIKKVHRIDLDDRKIKMSEITDMVKISTECVRHILHEHLGMKQLSARWVPGAGFSNNRPEVAAC